MVLRKCNAGLSPYTLVLKSFALKFSTMKKLYFFAITMALALSSSAQELSLEYLSSYQSGVFDEGAAEIVTYDALSNRLYFTNADANSVGIINFDDPTALALESEIDLDAYGDGVNSVSAYQGIIAVAVEGAETMDRGKIVFFDSVGTFLAEVEAGYLPDMVTFNRDGSLVVAANEGEPNDDWTEDPEGSITIVDISGGVASVTQANVTEIMISDYSGSWDGVRIFGNTDLEIASDDFQEEDTINFDTVFVYWEQFNLQGSSRQWHEYEFPSGSGNLYARMSGFDGGCQDNEDYLISEEFDIPEYEAVRLSFLSAYNFGGPDLELLISTDFDGSDVLAASWDTLTDEATWPANGGYEWEASGDIDLEEYAGESVHIAFLYTSNAGGCKVWQVDDVAVVGDLSDDANFEPEYVAISEDNSTAFVAMQENNAVMVVNLSTKELVDVHPLGYKDHSVAGNGLDASNRDDEINITTYPFRGLYLPDAITTIDIAGVTYILTANEGDSRDYDGYSEEERLKDIDLDSTVFPDAATLQEDENGGRINVTTSMGDTDGDGDFDEIYTYGARSFSIWNTSGSLIYDSGDEFEQTIAMEEEDNFNSTNDETDSFDARSDDKGPEPEAIEVATINGKHYAFIGLERIGGIMMYDITDPTAPVYVQYINNRDFSVEFDVDGEGDPDPTAAQLAAVGDLGCEDVLFIDGKYSKDSIFYLVTSNEVSGTVSVFKINGAIVPAGISEVNGQSEIAIYPNPAHDFVNIDKKGNYRVIDMTGRTVISETITNRIDISALNSGIYFVESDKGDIVRFVKS